jgi:hypothetical protein
VRDLRIFGETKAGLIWPDFSCAAGWFISPLAMAHHGTSSRRTGVDWNVRAPDAAASNVFIPRKD